MYKKSENTGSNKTNREMTLEKMDIRVSLSSAEEELLFDPRVGCCVRFRMPSRQNFWMRFLLWGCNRPLGWGKS
jgi:hypothetical protein